MLFLICEILRGADRRVFAETGMIIMRNGKLRRRLSAAAAVCIVIAAVIAAAAFFRSGTYAEYRDMKREKLTKFSYSSGGDMNGSHHSRDIVRYGDGRALVTEYDAVWYADDGKTSEYFVDEGVLDELAGVFRKYNMRRWERRKISKMFVCDGASYSYGFTFGKTSSGFSSQYYAGKYRRGTDAIDGVIVKYAREKELLPSLVLPEKDGGDPYQVRIPEAGKVTMEVFRYGGLEIHCRILNGTENAITFSERLRLFNADSGEEIAVTNPKYASKYSVSAGQTAECSAKVSAVLPAGRYRAESGEYSAEFEIAVQG